MLIKNNIQIFFLQQNNIAKFLCQRKLHISWNNVQSKLVILEVEHTNL